MEDQDRAIALLEARLKAAYDIIERLEYRLVALENRFRA